MQLIFYKYLYLFLKEIYKFEIFQLTSNREAFKSHDEEIFVRIFDD